MAHSWGKPIGLAAQVLENTVICQIDCEKQHIELAKKALKRFSSKLPGKSYIEVYDNARKAIL
jgi:ribosomal protein L16/L10AE